MESGTDPVEAKILELVSACGPGRSVSPDDVARALAGSDTALWSRMMPAIRQAAMRLWREERIAILRKGRPVEGEGFRGVYRLGPPQRG